MSARVAAALYAAFRLPAPAVPPPPAAPDRFPVFAPTHRPAPTPWHPERLALAGAVTLASRS